MKFPARPSSVLTLDITLFCYLWQSLKENKDELQNYWEELMKCTLFTTTKCYCNAPLKTSICTSFSKFQVLVQWKNSRANHLVSVNFHVWDNKADKNSLVKQFYLSALKVKSCFVLKYKALHHCQNLVMKVLLDHIRKHLLHIFTTFKRLVLKVTHVHKDVLVCQVTNEQDFYVNRRNILENLANNLFGLLRIALVRGM